MRISEKNGALIFTRLGYIWNIGGIRIPIPNWAILGDAEITEQAISDDEFHIDFNMVHPLLGKTFSYSGCFSISGNKKPCT